MIPADRMLAEDDENQPKKSPEPAVAPTEVRLDVVADAVAAIRSGHAVVVVDDADRENEGDLIFAASRATPEIVGFMIHHTSGVVCVPMEAEQLDRLELPPMTAVNQDSKQTAYAVSVDARDGISTGISAADRAHTIKVLADSATEPWELTRPGHIFPLRAVPGGVLRRAGHTEAAVDLARLAGVTPAGAIAELVHEDGSMMRAPECREFADEHGLTMISIADLIAYVRRTETQVERVVETELPTEFGDFRAIGYRSTIDGQDHIALVTGDVGDGQDLLVRVHSECLTGDALGSVRCACAIRVRITGRNSSISWVSTAQNSGSPFCRATSCTIMCVNSAAVAAFGVSHVRLRSKVKSSPRPRSAPCWPIRRTPGNTEQVPKFWPI